MLKLTRRLFLRDADPARIDFYERGLFNHILASQDPATGMVTYYVAAEAGGLAQLLDARGLVLVLRRDRDGEPGPLRRGDLRARRATRSSSTSSSPRELTWREKGLTLRQETRFPDEDRTRLVLRLEKPRALRPAPAPPGLGRRTASR